MVPAGLAEYVRCHTHCRARIARRRTLCPHYCVHHTSFVFPSHHLAYTFTRLSNPANRLSTHQVDRIDVSGIKPSRLANAGLLIATLFSEDTEIIEVKLVVQVSQEEKGGSFTRCIFNPLE